MSDALLSPLNELIVMNLSLEELIHIAENPVRSPVELDSAVLAVLQRGVGQLTRMGSSMCIISSPGDSPHLIFKKTIEEQKRERLALLENRHLSLEQKAELKALNPEHSLNDLIKLNNLIEALNMSLIEQILTAYERNPDQEVFLGSRGLTRLPEALINRLAPHCQNETLEVIHLHDNKLSYLPTIISLLTRIKNLDLQRNQIRSLPKEIGLLTQLQHLDLDHNQLNALPEEISSLTNLVGLWIEKNQFNILPTYIGSLINLEILDLKDNQFNTLPKELSLLTNLSQLKLYGNPLERLPYSLSELLTQTKNLPYLKLLQDAPGTRPSSSGKEEAMDSYSFLPAYGSSSSSSSSSSIFEEDNSNTSSKDSDPKRRKLP